MKKLALAVLPLAISTISYAEEVVEFNQQNVSVASGNAAQDTQGDWELFDSSTADFSPANLVNYSNQLSINVVDGNTAALLLGEEQKYFVQVGEGTLSHSFTTWTGSTGTVNADVIDLGWAKGNQGAKLSVALNQSQEPAMTSITMQSTGDTVELLDGDSFSFQDPEFVNSPKFDVAVTDNSASVFQVEVNGEYGLKMGERDAVVTAGASLNGNTSSNKAYTVKETIFNGSGAVSAIYQDTVAEEIGTTALNFNLGGRFAMPYSENSKLIFTGNASSFNSTEVDNSSKQIQQNTDATGANESDITEVSEEEIVFSTMYFISTAGYVYEDTLGQNTKLVLGQAVLADFYTMDASREVVKNSTTNNLNNSTTNGTKGVVATVNSTRLGVRLPFSAAMQVQLSKSFVGRASVSGNLYAFYMSKDTSSDTYEKDNAFVGRATDKLEASLLTMSLADSATAEFGFGYTPLENITVDANISASTVDVWSSITATYTF